ncbi:hypothetical protein FQR65_LT19807 [Abscondita terminalis]|nr:hypothetical protein FQR65_LT19807 [Abscondita terminalis]
MDFSGNTKRCHIPDDKGDTQNYDVSAVCMDGTLYVGCDQVYGDSTKQLTTFDAYEEMLAHEIGAFPEYSNYSVQEYKTKAILLPWHQILANANREMYANSLSITIPFNAFIDNAKRNGYSVMKYKKLIQNIVSYVKAWVFDNFGINLNLNPDDMVALSERMVNQIKQQTSLDTVRQKYQGTSQWMTAPNGEKSNLNEQQWLQVRTPEFKKLVR